MIIVSPDAGSTELRTLIFEANRRTEKVEVLLSTLLSLKNDNERTFDIPYDDFIVILQTITDLIRN